MRYKFISIEEGPKKVSNKPCFLVTNNSSGDVLGWIAYYAKWRQFVFSAASDQIVFNKECLGNILQFLSEDWRFA